MTVREKSIPAILYAIILIWEPIPSIFHNKYVQCLTSKAELAWHMKMETLVDK